ncbi:hypothetical protein SKC42_26155 [Mycobacterium sp. 050134]
MYGSLGFDDAVGDEVVRDPVITSVVEPNRLLDVDRVLAEQGRTSASLSLRPGPVVTALRSPWRALPMPPPPGI